MMKLLFLLVVIQLLAGMLALSGDLNLDTLNRTITPIVHQLSARAGL
jgi:hypothetical protein